MSGSRLTLVVVGMTLLGFGIPWAGSHWQFSLLTLCDWTVHVAGYGLVREQFDIEASWKPALRFGR